MKKIKNYLYLETNQKRVNLVITIILFTYIILNVNYVHLASGIDVHNKFYVIKFIFIAYLAQTMLNRLWLNHVIVLIYAIFNSLLFICLRLFFLRPL